MTIPISGVLRNYLNGLNCETVKPEISVIISPYNAELWVAETLDSVLAQTFSNIEIIVVDGGSTDRTVEIVSRYGSPVRLIAEGRCTKSVGKNTGIRASQGNCVAFVDADDLWLPQKIELQLQLLRERPDLGWVYTDGYLFEDNTPNNLTTFGKLARLYAGDILPRLLLNDFIPSPTPLIRRQVLDRVGYFDETLLRHQPEDWDLWLRLAAFSPVGLVNQPLVRYRMHSESLMAREDPQLALDGKISIIERAVARDPSRLASLRARAMGHCYRQAAGTYAKKERWTEARQMYVRAIKFSPGLASAYAGWAACFLDGWLWRKAFDLRRRLFWRKQ